MYQRKKVQKGTSPRKLPSAPKSCLKYKEVPAVVDAGPNVRKRREALEVIRQYYNVRPDELFRRINPSTLVTLMVEVARLRLQSTAAGSPLVSAPSSDEKPPSDLQSLVEGCGELSLSAGDAPPVAPSIDDQPYLLLDVRDQEAFQREHVITARHYPAARLARTMNYETAEMWRFRTHPRAIVVICDEDESAAPRCATTLAQRGYDNVFILSGGLKMARKKFSCGLLTTEDRQQLTAADIESLSCSLDTFCASAANPQCGASSASSVRSVGSTTLPGARPFNRGTGRPSWNL